MKIEENRITFLRIGDKPGVVRLSQKKLADKIGVSVPTLCAYESGRSIPRLDHVLALMEVFNLELNEIFILK